MLDGLDPFADQRSAYQRRSLAKNVSRTALILLALAAAGILNQGKAETAANVIGSFINQVEAFMNAGILTEAEGYYLIDLAETSLSCTG